MEAYIPLLSDSATKLVVPLLRLMLAMSLGLLIANLIEALHWTRFVARVSSPLVRLGHLGETAGASFSLAFFSPAAANALLGEGYERGKLSKRELILANLFNSSPAYLVHLPSLFFLMFAFLGMHAFTYVGLTFAAASMRTIGTLAAGRVLLPSMHEKIVPDSDPPRKSKKELAIKALERFKARFFKLLVFTVPVYCLVFIMQQAGWFIYAEEFMAKHASLLSFLPPQALGIIALSLMAEMNLALSAAAPLLASGALQMQEVILALLVGNIVSSPMRAFRHQFPAYAGYFKPAMAGRLVAISQLFRMGSLSIVTFAYYLLAF